MLQKEDLVHQPDQTVPNALKWRKRLTIILTSVLLLVIVGMGGYWLGARRQQSSPPHLLTTPKPSWSPSATPVQQRYVSPTATTSQTDPTTNWKAYLNEEYGFEVKIPTSWFIYYEATQENILSQLNTNKKYRLHRGIKLVGWQDVPPYSGYPGIGYITISLYSKPLTDQFLEEQMSYLNHKTVQVDKRIINGNSFTEVISVGDHEILEGSEYSFRKDIYLAISHPNFQTISLSGIGWYHTRERLEPVLEEMVSSLNIID